MKTALVKRLERLEEVRAVESQPPVEFQIGYVKRLPHEYTGERHVVTVGRAAEGTLLIVVTDARQKLALDSGICVQILREAGHLDTTGPSCVVDLVYIPDGLGAVELEHYLREHGARPRTQQSC